MATIVREGATGRRAVYQLARLRALTPPDQRDAMQLGNVHVHAGKASFMQQTYSKVVADLKRASIPVRELHGRGHVALTLAAGRIVALAFRPDEPNLFWSNARLGDTDIVENAPQELVGGIGGDRLWFAPELHYHWIGKPDWQRVTNYKVPADADPGNYSFVEEGPSAVALSACGRLPIHNSDRHVGFSVERRVRMTDAPLPSDGPLMRNVDYVGIETRHTLNIADDTRTGQVDLWHLLQIPVDATLIVPLCSGRHTELVSYGMAGGWAARSDCLVWRITGNANAKIGLAAAAVTGRAGVLQKLGADRWTLLVRQFSADPNARYCDHPYGAPREDQVFQAWDGFGFGEMEYHSPLLDAERGPRSLQDVDQLWAFGGSRASIAALGQQLLSVEIASLMR